MWWLHLLLQGGLSSCALWVQPQCLHALPDSALGAQQTYTCSCSHGGMKGWSRWLSIPREWIWPVMAEFCFSLYSSIFLGRRPMVQEQPKQWHCSAGGSAPLCHPAAGPPDTGGSVVGGGHGTWALLPRRLRKGESTGCASGQYLASIFTCWSHVCLTLRHPVLLNQLDTKSSVH